MRWYWSIRHWYYDFQRHVWKFVKSEPIKKYTENEASLEFEEAFDRTPQANYAEMAWWNGKTWVPYDHVGPYHGM